MLELSVELALVVLAVLSVEMAEALPLLRATLVRLRWGVTTGEVRPAGIEAAGSWEVTATGWLVTATGWEVTATGWPVTTPLASV